VRDPVAGRSFQSPTGAVSIGCGPDLALSAVCEAAARARLSWANMDAARIGADPEPAESGTGGPLRFSLGRIELARIRTARPSATNATTNP
jgi:hypothetical protein